MSQLVSMTIGSNNGLDENNIISLNSIIKPSKGDAGFTNSLLSRDIKLEKEVKEWINERTSFANISKKYSKYDTRINTLEWPLHYPTRFIEINGVLAEGRNIFIVFPLALGKVGKTNDDYFGFEFIDIWEKVFNDIVFPCIKNIFDQSTVKQVEKFLKPNLAKTIYLASIFHEIGHRVGPWKVVPEKDSKIQLSKFYINTLCELATDTILVLFLDEFPEIKYFVLFQRLFWFGRFGFSKENDDGDIKNDNDTWIGSYLWIKLTENSCIVKSELSYTLDFSKVQQTFVNILQEITDLNITILSSKNQDEVVKKWMELSIHSTINNLSIPDDLKEVFQKCLDIPTKVKI